MLELTRREEQEHASKLFDNLFMLSKLVVVRNNMRHIYEPAKFVYHQKRFKVYGRYMEFYTRQNKSFSIHFSESYNDSYDIEINRGYKNTFRSMNYNDGTKHCKIYREFFPGICSFFMHYFIDAFKIEHVEEFDIIINKINELKLQYL